RRTVLLPVLLQRVAHLAGIVLDSAFAERLDAIAHSEMVAEGGSGRRAHRPPGASPVSGRREAADRMQRRLSLCWADSPSRLFAIVPQIKRVHKIAFEEATALSKLAVLELRLHPEANYYSLQAVKKFEEVLRSFPSDSRALHNWGLVLYYQARRAAGATEADRLYKLSARKFEQALLHRRRHQGTIIQLAMCLAQRGELYRASNAKKFHRLTLQAIDKYKEAIELSPLPFAGMFNYANTLYSDGVVYLAEERADMQLGEAAASTAAAGGRPRSNTAGKATVPMLSATMRPMSEMRLNEARHAYETALQVHPRSGPLRLNYALCLLKLSQLVLLGRTLHESALEQFRAASELTPKSYEVFFNWGNALLRFASRFTSGSERARALSLAMHKFHRVLKLCHDSDELFRNWLDALVLKDRIEPALSGGELEIFEKEARRYLKDVPLSSSSPLDCVYLVRQVLHLRTPTVRMLFETAITERA
ncbi:MAG TPA: hypothetical protein VJB16_07790, partial [archaeon]|nr:hypothetical protein [archaeon]